RVLARLAANGERSLLRARRSLALAALVEELDDAVAQLLREGGGGGREDGGAAVRPGAVVDHREARLELVVGARGEVRVRAVGADPARVGGERLRVDGRAQARRADVGAGPVVVAERGGDVGEEGRELVVVEAEPAQEGIE